MEFSVWSTLILIECAAVEKMLAICSLNVLSTALSKIKILLSVAWFASIRFASLRSWSGNTDERNIMSAPQMEPTIDAWISVCEKLTPLQNFAVIGLLFLKPNTPPSIIATQDPVTPENIHAAERWTLTTFRRLFAYYCDHYENTSVQIAGEFIDKVEFVKKLGPVIVYTFSIPLGVVVSFLFAALGIGLKKWCGKYAKQEFNGKGTYSGNFPKREVDGFFEIMSLPPIEEYVEEPEAYPLKVYKVAIKVPAEITGKVKVPMIKDSDEIFFSFKENTLHVFDFEDARLKKRITGEVNTLLQDKPTGANVLAFTTNDLKIS